MSLCPKHLHIAVTGCPNCECIKAAMAKEPVIPEGMFGYCAVCYHPLDRCSHCDATHTAQKEALLKIAGLVNAYHNDATTLSAAETLEKIANALGKPF